MSQTKAQLISDLVQALAFTATASAPTNGMFLSATNELAISTNSTQRLTVDSSGKVGIGTSSPGKKVVVNHGASDGLMLLAPNTAESTLYFGDTDDDDIGRIIYDHSIDAMKFRTNTSERMRIDSSGNVGIGLTSPTEFVDIRKDQNAFTWAQIQNQNSSSGAYAGIQFGAHGNTWGLANGSSAANSNSLVFVLDAGGSNSEKMRIDSSGNVGIGTTSPGEKLHVTGNLRIDSGSNGLLDIGDVTSNYGRIYADSTGTFVGSVTSNPLILRTTNTERMRIDTSGRLLVGTSSTSLTSKLIVRARTDDSNGNGSITLQRGAIPSAVDQLIGAVLFTDSGDNYGAWILASSEGAWTSGSSHPTRLVFSTTASSASSPTERMRIDSLGNVGINVTPPSDAYSGTKSIFINDRAAIVGWKTVLDEATSITNNFYYNSSGSNKFIEDGYANKLDLRAGTLRYSVSSASGTAGATASINETFRIDSSGRLLVGTSSALDTETVSPKIQSADAGNQAGFGAFRYSNNSPGPIIHLFKSRGTSVGTNTVVQSNDSLGEIRFSGADGTNEIRGAHIKCLVDGTPGTNDMPGRLVFSTTADGASSPTERFRIGSFGRSHSFSSDGATQILANANGGSTSDYLIIGRHSSTAVDNGTNAFFVYTNGNVKNTNNSYGQISDVKLKENIVNANSQWDDIKGVQVRNFNFKQETGNPTHTQIGVVAQELETVSPGLVYETPDRDAEGNDLGTVTKSVNYSVLYMKAVKALQEAMDRIETLETKVAALEAE